MIFPGGDALSSLVISLRVFTKASYAQMNIRKITKLDVADVERCHAASWQMAFRGILSVRLLDNRITSQFEENWVCILERPSRVNLVVESKTSIL
jgi:hypothetical protein